MANTVTQVNLVKSCQLEPAKITAYANICT